MTLECGDNVYMIQTILIIYKEHILLLYKENFKHIKNLYIADFAKTCERVNEFKEVLRGTNVVLKNGIKFFITASNGDVKLAYTWILPISRKLMGS